MRRQLENFANALSDYSGEDVDTPKDWHAAFRMLKNYLLGVCRPGKLVVFLDEVPWMETRKSDFVQDNYGDDENFWTNRIDSSIIVRGRDSRLNCTTSLSCFGHIRCGYPSVFMERQNESGKRSQIDLLIDRRDGVIDLCEEKFVSGLYSITKGCEFALPFVFSPYFADTYGGKGCQLLIHSSR